MKQKIKLLEHRGVDTLRTVQGICDSHDVKYEVGDSPNEIIIESDVPQKLNVVIEESGMLVFHDIQKLRCNDSRILIFKPIYNNMKFFRATIIIAVILFICSCATQGQTTQTKLNQVELMKLQIGTWKCDSNKDTTVFWVGKSYGTGLDCYSKNVVKGKIVKEGRELWGYDKSIDKFICATLDKGKDIEIQAVWFVSKNGSL